MSKTGFLCNSSERCIQDTVLDWGKIATFEMIVCLYILECVITFVHPRIPHSVTHSLTHSLTRSPTHAHTWFVALTTVQDAFAVHGIFRFLTLVTRLAKFPFSACPYFSRFAAFARPALHATELFCSTTPVRLALGVKNCAW